MRIFLHQKAKVIDVPLSILPSWGCIDTYSKIDSKNSVNVFHREVGIIMILIQGPDQQTATMLA